MALRANPAAFSSNTGGTSTFRIMPDGPVPAPVNPIANTSIAAQSAGGFKPFNPYSTYNMTAQSGAPRENMVSQVMPQTGAPRENFVSPMTPIAAQQAMLGNPAETGAPRQYPITPVVAQQAMQGYVAPLIAPVAPVPAPVKAAQAPQQQQEQPATAPVTTNTPQGMTQEQIIAAMQGYNPQAQAAGMNTYTNSLTNQSTPDQFANNAYSQAAFDSVAADINKQYDLARTRKIQDLQNRGLTNYAEGNPGREVDMLEQERQQALAKARTDIQTSGLQNMYANYFQQQGLDLNRGSLGLQGNTQMAGLGLNAASLGQQSGQNTFNNQMAQQNFGLDSTKFIEQMKLNNFIAQQAQNQQNVDNANKQVEYDLMRRQLQAGKDGGFANFLGNTLGSAARIGSMFV